MNQSKLKLAVISVIWIAVLSVVALVYRYWWAPTKQKEKEQQAVAEHLQTLEKTSSKSHYTATVAFGIDDFAGYAPLRSQFFKDECGKYGVRIDYTDDGANYPQRLKALADGKLDMAVFTIDALIKTSAEMGDFPATIVGLIDESKGADALLGPGKSFPNLDALNAKDVKIVCVGNSPSETLTRVVMAHFNLNRLDKEPFEFVDSAEKVYDLYRQAKPTDKKVFALWEPYVSLVQSNPDYQMLVDSSKFRGYIMDVIVVRRGFLLKNETTVEAVMKSYLTTIFAQRNEMMEMVLEDSKTSGKPLKKEQADRLCKTIWWKNTQESFGHFGLAQSGMQPMEEICRNITEVMLKTGAMSKDPTHGKPTMWYYDGVMRKLFETSWHPGFGSEDVRKEKTLLSLTDAEWKKLRSVGTLQVPRLVYARGTDRMTPASESTLVELTEKLKNWPNYYLVVRGNASSEGDVEANLKLATSRAESAVKWLTDHGVDSARIRAESGKPNGSTTVAFILGEMPY